jgi:snurportin-1
MSIPYYTDTTLPTLYRHIIPIIRTPRSFTIDIPNLSSPTFQPPNTTQQESQSDGMDVEPPMFTFGSNQNETSLTMNSTIVTVSSDGLLLYVAEATYETGTSPLSTWIPLVSYDEVKMGDEAREAARPLDVFERYVLTLCDTPFHLFSFHLLRLLCRRLQNQGAMTDRGVVEVEMD